MPFRIKELREEKGWTQKQLAQESGVSQNLIARLESGSLKSTSTDTLFKLAEALGTKAKFLFLDC